MIEHEVKVWRKFQEDLKRIISNLTVLCETENSTVFHWSMLSSLTAFAYAHSHCFEELVEQGYEDGGILNSVWNPYRIDVSSPSIRQFFESSNIRNWWQVFFKEKCPVYDDAIYLHHPCPSKSTRYDIVIRVIGECGEGYEQLLFAPVLYLYSKPGMGNSRIMKFCPYASGYRVSNMIEDLGLIEDDMNNARALFGYEFGDLMSSWYKSLLELLSNTSEDFLILGKDMSTLAQVEQWYETYSGPEKMKEELRMQAVSHGDASAMTTEEAEYYDSAKEYLKGVDYISEDEIDGIVNSAFITHGPERGLEVIRQLY